MFHILFLLTLFYFLTSERFGVVQLWSFVDLLVLGSTQTTGPRMSLLYHKFMFMIIFIYIYNIFSTHMSKCLSYWFFLDFSEDAKDSCCLLSPTNDSTFSPLVDLNLRPGIRNISYLRTLFQWYRHFCILWFSGRSYRLGCVKHNDSTKTYLSRNECVVRSF